MVKHNKLKKQIIIYLWKKKPTSRWIKEVKIDVEKNNIKVEKAIERNDFRESVKNGRIRGQDKEKRSVKMDREHRKKRHAEKVKEYLRKKEERGKGIEIGIRSSDGQ